MISWFECLTGYESLPPPSRPAAIAAPVWQDRTIASEKLRLLEYSAFMETQREAETVHTHTHTHGFFDEHLLSLSPDLILPDPPSLSFFFFFKQYKHLFVHIGQSNPSYSDPVLESVDVRQIYDKFPEKKGGLKELYEKGPHTAFFLVKFWVSAYNGTHIVMESLEYPGIHIFQTGDVREFEQLHGEVGEYQGLLQSWHFPQYTRMYFTACF